MRRLSLVAVLVFAGAGNAAAQKLELAGGYTYMGFDTNLPNVNRVNLNGWNGSIGLFPVKYVGLVGEFTGTYGSPNILGVQTDLNVHTYMFGPRVVLPALLLRPYAQALFGGARRSATALGIHAVDTDFAMSLGGGLDLNLPGPLDVRLAQVDWLRTQFGGTDQNHWRYSAGIVFRW